MTAKFLQLLKPLKLDAIIVKNVALVMLHFGEAQRE